MTHARGNGHSKGREMGEPGAAPGERLFDTTIPPGATAAKDVTFQVMSHVHPWDRGCRIL